MTDQNAGQPITGQQDAVQPGDGQPGTGQPASGHQPTGQLGTGQHNTDQLADLEEQARDAINQLAEVPDPDAFQALLRLSALVGEGLGINARALATNGSWAKVAEVAGTSRQAAWSRWSS